MSLSFGNINIPTLHLPVNMNLQDFMAMLSAKYERYHAAVIQEFGPNGFYILILFAAFLTLILVIYIKSVIDTFRIGNESADDENTDEGLFYTKDTKNPSADPSLVIMERQRDAGDDLRPHLTVKSENETENTMPTNLEREKFKASLRHPFVRAKKDNAKLLQQMADANDKIFDWKKDDETGSEQERPNRLHYQPPKETLEELISLIINMLSRGVHVQKIAQAIYYRTQGAYSEEDIIQVIRSVKDFIGLCNAGEFDTLPDRRSLPRNDEALYNWAKGDSSQCLSLLESLLNYQIDKAEIESGTIQEMAYAQAANSACLMGTIAGLTDQELAYDAYKLAIELSPQNVNAWSRMADLHQAENQQDKAVYAYQTVLELGDNPIYAEHIANAKNKLASYYQTQGISAKAEVLKQAGLRFYQEYGIRTALTDSETQALDVIAENQAANLQSSIAKLLNSRQTALA